MEKADSTDAPALVIRPYGEADAAATLAIFLAAVTETAAADYSPEQIQAWARPDSRDLDTWHAAMRHRAGYVATVDGAAVGFSDVSPAGYIDMLFVSPRYQRRGIARRLLRYVEAQARDAQAADLTADVSITARPLFERSGFTVQEERHPVKSGVQLTNFRMRKQLR